MDILIVENSPEFIADIQDMLNYASGGAYRLHKAHTGLDGIRLTSELRQNPRHCVLLSCTLPDMGVQDFITTLRGEDEMTVCPVVILTADKSTHGMSFIRLGAQDYVNKSGLTSSTLMRVLQTAVERFELILENKKTLKQLLEREARLQTLLEESETRRLELEALMEAVPAQVWISRDRDCRNMIGNRAVSEFLNTPCGANVSMTAPPDQRPKTFDTYRNGKLVPLDQLPMQQAARTGIPVRGIDLELRFSDGTSKWIYGNVEPLKDASGTLYGAIGGMVDFTEEKRAYELLARHDELMRRTYNTTRSYLVVLTLEGIVVAGNAFALNLIGKHLEDVVGMPFCETGWMRTAPGARAIVDRALQRASAGDLGPLDLAIEPSLEQSLKLGVEFVPIRDETGTVVNILVEGC